MLDHEARYGPTKCPPLPYERVVTNSQQTKACEGLWSEGEAAGQREGSALQGKAVGSSTRQKQHSESRAGSRGKERPQLWSQAGLRLTAGVTSALPGHSSHTLPDLHRHCFHQVCGEPRCGRTHSTFCGQPFCAATHGGAGTKSSQQGKPKCSIT